MARKASAREPRKTPGAALADKLARLGIAREADLVLHLPLRYEDHTRLVPLASLQPGVEQQAEGTVAAVPACHHALVPRSRRHRPLPWLSVPVEVERGNR